MTTQNWQWCISKAATATLITIVAGPLGICSMGPTAVALPEPPPVGRPTDRIDGGGARVLEANAISATGQTQFIATTAFVPVPPTNDPAVPSTPTPRGSGSR